MSMKLDLGKVFFFILLLVLSTMTAMAGNIKGTVLDKQTKEPLTGATIQITGTAQGVVADIDGNYTLNVNDGTYTITVRYIGYKDILLNSIKVKAETLLNFEMESDAQTLGEVSVVAKKNLEGERALQMERQKATLAIENLGAKEKRNEYQRNQQCGRRCKKDNRYLHRQCRTVDCARSGRPVQHHHSERTSHRLS